MLHAIPSETFAETIGAVSPAIRSRLAVHSSAMRSKIFVLFVVGLSASLAAAEGGVEIATRRNIALQISLDRAGFSPGVIDGKIGGRTEIALREFLHAHGLMATDSMQAASAAGLCSDPDLATIDYVVGFADVANIAPTPKTWPEKSKSKFLGYESISAALAEKFHCSRELLAKLNPNCDLDRLSVGRRIVAPNVADFRPIPRVKRVEVDTDAKTVRLVSDSGKTAALFHCSVAAKPENLPRGRAVVEQVVSNPEYRFDPRMWPEVKGVDHVLMIPRGPRNPVGVCWIDLSLPGYGIHGTPHPELIGKTGSHGCIRLTNWDALRVGRSVQSGTEVIFATKRLARNSASSH